MGENLIIDAAEMAVPGLGEAKTAFAVVKLLWPLLAALGVLAAGVGVWLHLKHLEADLAQARAQAAQQHAVATVQTGQANAAGDAAAIVDAGRAKADVTVHIQQENQRALLAAPGAAQAVDPGFAAALDRSLCAFDAYAADPGCAAVRAPDPGQPAPADSGHPAAAGPDHSWRSGRDAEQPDRPA